VRIGIDNVSPGHATGFGTIGGFRHFLQDTLTWLVKIAPQHEYVLFQPRWADPLDITPHASVRVQHCAGVPKQRIGRVMYEQSRYARLIDRSGIDVFLACNNVIPLRLKTPSVVLMASLQYFDFPQIYSWLNLVYLRRMVPRSLQKVRGALASSHTSKQTILERVNVPSERIHVVYYGLSAVIEGNRRGEEYEAGCRMVESLSGGKPYILSVSSFYWQKNLFRLVEAFALLKRKQGLSHRLLLVGGDSGKVTGRDLLEHARALGVEDSVVCPGVIVHARIAAFYMNASLTVMPSLYETFGHPIVEAMSCGCPVVTSNIGTMAEIAQNCAALVDPYSADSIAEGMARVLSDIDLKKNMVSCGLVRARDFTAEIQTREYVRVLEGAARK